MLAPGILLRMYSAAEIGVDMSWRPAITSVGLLIVGNASRRSSVDSASQQAIYCGVPAANHAVKEAAAIVAELGLLRR